jgi:hypothetical protein
LNRIYKIHKLQFKERHLRAGSSILFIRVWLFPVDPVVKPEACFKNSDAGQTERGPEFP